MRIAVTRPVSASIERCELTHLSRTAIDLERASAQHAAYEALLETHGWRIERLAAEPELPDAVFVEDAAIVLDEVAVITRPGAESRRAETSSVARALEPHRALDRVEAPATLDGGDVIRAGRTLFVGLGQRTSSEGAARLSEIVRPWGYIVVPTQFAGCLHLKSAASAVADDRILLNPEWVDPAAFPGFRTIAVDPGEPAAGNALRLAARTLLLPASAPATRRRLESEGFRVESADVSELEKAEAGVTCCSLLFESFRVS